MKTIRIGETWTNEEFNSGLKAEMKRMKGVRFGCGRSNTWTNKNAMNERGVYDNRLSRKAMHRYERKTNHRICTEAIRE